MAKRRKIYHLSGATDTFKKGKNALKSKETLKRIGFVAGGSLLGQVAVAISNKLTNSFSRQLQYAVGTASAGAVTIASLGMGQEFLGFGAGMVTANQLINTASTLINGKNLQENLSSK